MESRVLQALAPHLPTRRLRAGDVLFQEGDPGDAMAIVASGRLRLEVAVPGAPPEVLGEVGAGDVVGEMACLDPAPRSATVRALEDVEVRMMDRGTLTTLRERAPGTWVDVVRATVTHLGDRVREADRRVEEMSFSLRMAGGAFPGEEPAAAGARTDPARPQRLGLLSDSDLAVFAQAAHTRVLADGEWLCREGEEASSCFLVRAGRLEVVRQGGDQDLRLATLVEGSIAGHNALVDGGWRTASLRARGATEVLELDRATFDRLLDARVPLALRFQEQLAVAGIRQLRTADRWLARLGSSEVAARTASGFMPRTPAPVPAPARLGTWDADPRAIPLSSAPLPAAPVPPRDDEEASRHVKAYMRTALREWGMSIEELDEVRVVVPEGQVTAAEVRARRRWFS
jgi:CRP-like cAMP-binding protein